MLKNTFIKKKKQNESEGGNNEPMLSNTINSTNNKTMNILNEQMSYKPIKRATNSSISSYANVGANLNKTTGKNSRV